MAKTQKTAQQPETATGEPVTNKVTPLKKLTIKTVCGGVKLKDIPDGEELLLARFAGVASGVDSGESTYGAWEMLSGEFAATSYLTGEIFVGKGCFVPAAMGEALIDSLKTAQSEDASAKLKFSVDISAVVSARDPNKYEYIVRPVIENDIKNEAMALLTLN